MAAGVDGRPVLEAVRASYAASETGVCGPLAPGLHLRHRLRCTHLVLAVGDDHGLRLLKVVNAFHGCGCGLLGWSASGTAALGSPRWQRLVVGLPAGHWWLCSCLPRRYTWLRPLLYVLHLNGFEGRGLVRVVVRFESRG